MRTFGATVVILLAANAMPLAAADEGSFAIGCNDDDERTPCCPIENMKPLQATLADWYACTQTIPPTPLPLEPPAGAQR